MRTVQQIAESGAAWLTEDELTAIVGDVLALRAENERLNHVLDEAAQCAKDAALAMLAATGIVGDLRAERDALAKRVADLEDTIDCGCNALTDSIMASGNHPRTNLHWVAKMRRALAGRKGEG